jgi:hypothetical protein
MILATKDDIAWLRSRSLNMEKTTRIADTAELALGAFDLLRAAHDELTNAGHQEISECECEIAAFIYNQRQTFCSKQCRKRLSPPRDCPYCSQASEPRDGEVAK